MALELTRSQMDVVALIAQGLGNKEISYRLGVEEATVKAHIGQANKRLELHNRVQLAVWYVTRELVKLQASTWALHEARVAGSTSQSSDRLDDEQQLHEASRGLASGPQS